MDQERRKESPETMSKRNNSTGDQMSVSPGGQRSPAPWWLLMVMTAMVVGFGLVGAGALFFLAMIALGGELDHGGLQLLLICVPCLIAASAFAYAALRWSKGW
jgi:hypothetical protein